MNNDPVKSSGHYIHRIEYNRRERMVGLFVFSALLLFAALIVISAKSQHFFEQRATFFFDVQSSEGISQGSVVTFLGTEVGKVSDLSFTHGRKIHVAIEVYKGHHELIRSDAKVIVNRLVGIGNALIEIQAGSVDAPLLADGAKIPVEETPSLNDLVLGIARFFQSADTDLLSKFDAILPKLEQTIDNAQKIIAQIATGQGTLGAAVFDLKVEQDMRTIVQSGAEIIVEAGSILSVAEQRLVELEPVIAGAETVVHDVQGATQSLPEMVVEIKKTIALTKTALTLINEELRHLPGIGLDARRTLNRADNLLEGTQNIWPLSTVIQESDSKPLIPIHPVHE